MEPSRKAIQDMYMRAQQRISQFHVRTFEGQPGPILLISTAYPGVWLEHAFDAICYARLESDSALARSVALGQLRLFLRNQLPNGRLPFNVMDASIMRQRGYGELAEVNYRQIQECVAFGQLCVEAHDLTGDDEFLREAYRGCAAWDAWLCAHRMTRGTGLIELFCLYDTGHDNSARLADVPVSCPDLEGATPADCDAVPMLAPDMNAVFYGNRRALAEMARRLGLESEAVRWDEAAERVRAAMLELLYDPQDEFFYDMDSKGRLRRFPSIAISNVFSEHVLERGMFDAIYERHMRDPAEFWSEYPFPSMALNSPAIIGHAPRNCWGYYSQALTALRCMRWMDYYGRSADYELLLERWLKALASQPDRPFAQELDPRTGWLTDCSEWYSSAMLLYMYAARRLGYVD